MKDISKGDIENNLPLVTRREFERKIQVGDYSYHPSSLMLIAGPCTVENRDQVMQIASAVKSAGANMLRGGVFKPLTFPYGDPIGKADRHSGGEDLPRTHIMSQEELFERAIPRLEILKEAGQENGLPVVSEVVYANSVSLMEKYVDMFQVGYRHMFNMDLIDRLARSSKPIVLKRHYGESLRSWLGVAEHFEARGKHDFILCERGISVPHTHQVESRAIADIQAIPAVNDYAPTVPIILDPSHATFKRTYVPAISKAAIAAGANGLLIEVHHDPENAWVDPLNAITIRDFEKLVPQLKAIHELVNITHTANVS